MPPITELPISNFTMHSGNRKNITVDVLDENDQPVDLTDGTAQLAFARTRGGTALFTKTGVLAGDPNNRVTFTIDPADTEALAGAYAWEAEYTDLGGRPSTVAYGTATVIANTL